MRPIAIATGTFIFGVASGGLLLPYLMADEVRPEVRDLTPSRIDGISDESEVSAQITYRATALIEKVQLLRQPPERLPCEIWARAKLEHEIVLGSQEHFASAHPDVLQGPAGVVAENAISMFQSLGEDYELRCRGV